VIKVYFDDSGTHDASVAVAVGGYLASVESWDSFQPKWRSVLDEYEIPYFHMTDFEARQKLFVRWEQHKRIALQGKLISLIREHTQAVFTAATIKADYEQVKDYYGVSVYIYTLYQALGGVITWADRVQFPGPIAYVISQRASNGEVETLRQRIIGDARLRRRFRLGSWVVADMRELNPLQAADMIAFETYKEMCNYIVPNREERPKRKSMEELLKGADIFNGYFYKGNFVAMKALEIF
jgi:hypothetical protein